MLVESSWAFKRRSCHGAGVAFWTIQLDFFPRGTTAGSAAQLVLGAKPGISAVGFGCYRSSAARGDRHDYRGRTPAVCINDPVSAHGYGRSVRQCVRAQRWFATSSFVLALAYRYQSLRSATMKVLAAH